MSVCVCVFLLVCIFAPISLHFSLSPPTTCVVRIKSDSACCLALALAVLSRLRARAPTAALFVEPSLSLSLARTAAFLACALPRAVSVCVFVLVLAHRGYGYCVAVVVAVAVVGFINQLVAGSLQHRTNTYKQTSRRVCVCVSVCVNMFTRQQQRQ